MTSSSVTSPSVTSPAVVSATGMLLTFSQAGVLDVADVHLAQTLSRLYHETDDEVRLAVALTCRAVRSGSSCLDLSTVRTTAEAELLDPAIVEELDPATIELVGSLPWPEPTQWLSAVQASSMTAAPDAPTNQHPLRVDHGLVFLERHWTAEQRTREHLSQRGSSAPPATDPVAVEKALRELFSDQDLAPGEVDLQARAVDIAARSWTSVIAGGPGTGKTTTVARLLALLNHQQSRPLSVALAAPSGKAAARLHSSVLHEWDRTLAGWAKPQLTPGLTVHRLLGAIGRDGGFRKGPDDPLSHDVVVLDEVSMLDLFMFERVLAALPPRTRLILVGDPHQLSSVDTGRVLADVTQLGLTVAPSDQTSAVVELQRNYRFEGAILDLAKAIVQGDSDTAAALLASPPDRSVELCPADVATLRGTTPENSALAAIPGLVEDLVGGGRRMIDAATAGDALTALTALDEHRLLCAHRVGPYGVAMFTREVADLLHHEVGHPLGGDFPIGRPVLATTNQSDIGVFNGDTGVVVASDQGARLALAQGSGARLISPSLVDGLQTLHAMTVHKSQGSQFDVVTVVLPPIGSPLLTRELLYTAVTRAKERVRLVGSLDQVRAAIERPTERLTGLGRRPL